MSAGIEREDKARLLLLFGFFLLFELLFRLKLGSIYTIAAFTILAFEWRNEDGAAGERAGLTLAFSAMFKSFIVCFLIYLVFSLFNIPLRTINNEWRWFQLP